MKTGVIIARFQTPYLHEGHQKLISLVKEKHRKVVVVLGVSAVKCSRKNPLDYYTREQMIKKAYPDLVVLPLRDHPSDEAWSTNLDQLLMSILPDEQFCLYGSRDSFITYYTGKFATTEFPCHGDYNATNLREQTADQVSDSIDFRAGVMYACYSQYTKVYPTVDVAVFRNNKTELLLGRKSNSKKWRFIGGFADATDASYEATAERELQEEAGQLQTGPMQYETSARIDDWRYRHEADKIITLLFSCDYQGGESIAQDDIVELQWFKVAELKQMITDGLTTAEHAPLFDDLLNKYL